MPNQKTSFTKVLKRYVASYYNHIVQEQCTLLIKANNRLEAVSTALMLMGKNYTVDQIDSLYEVNDDDYYTFEEAYNKYKRCYNGEEPSLPEAKWDEEEQDWYYKEDTDGTKYYY